MTTLETIRHRLDNLPVDPDALPPVGTLLRILRAEEPMMWARQYLHSDYTPAAAEALAGISFDPYSATVDVEGGAAVLKFGPTVFDFFGSDHFDRYLDEAARASDTISDAFARAGIPSAFEIIVATLEHLWPGPVEVATEKDRPYFAGVVRSIPDGTLPHIDNAQIETPDLSIGKTWAQGTILLYLEMPSSGGATKVFAKQPTEDDPTHAWGYAHEALNGVRFAGVTPNPGDMLLFPTTCIHQVDPIPPHATGRRITVSAFYGPADDGLLLVWS
ncbi:MAG: 2OG-Fe(II) oxygenase [Actinomycetota bacterium]